MNENELRNFDLNLLLTLHVLLEERSVTRAAERLNLSQSAISHSLTRLREALNDPLFVRGRHTMTPTAKAETLAEPLRQLLAQAHRLIVPPNFDVTRFSGILRIATTDYGALVILPELLRQITHSAPNVTVEVHPWSNETARQLDAGTLDIALGGQDPFPDLQWTNLFSDRLVFAVDARHPLARRRAVTISDIVAFPHAVITVVASRMNIIDKELIGLGLSRQQRLKIPYFLSAPSIILGTDLILTIPEVGARRLQQSTAITLLEIPILIPEYRYKMFWGRKNDDRLFHQWVRSETRDACAKLTTLPTIGAGA
ncbi:MAG: LysR family transcriptional regulator [Alphaproteobacteria bacterium]